MRGEFLDDARLASDEGLVALIIWIVVSRFLRRRRAKVGSAPAENDDESGKSTSLM